MLMDSIMLDKAFVYVNVYVLFCFGFDTPFLGQACFDFLYAGKITKCIFNISMYAGL